MRFRGQRRCHECRQLCPPPPPKGPPDTVPATCWDKPGWGTGTGAGCSQAGQRDEGMRGAAGSWEIQVPGVRKGKEGDRSEPGWTQACGEEFRIAASLHPAPQGTAVRFGLGTSAGTEGCGRVMLGGTARPGGPAPWGGLAVRAEPLPKRLAARGHHPKAMLPRTAGAAGLPTPLHPPKEHPGLLQCTQTVHVKEGKR